MRVNCNISIFMRQALSELLDSVEICDIQELLSKLFLPQ